jgi:class 3 adenylate cyclase
MERSCTGGMDLPMKSGRPSRLAERNRPAETAQVDPETRYTKAADGVYIAYQSVGHGPLDLALMPGFLLGNVEILWEHSVVSSFLHKLASIGRLILHDRRGTGLSDRATKLPDLETRAADLMAVLDAAGSTRTVLIGGGEGGALPALSAATRPHRVSSLIWWLPTPRTRWAPDYPWGQTDDEERSWLGEIERGWGTEAFVSAELSRSAPSLRGDAGFIRWLARMQRHWVTPGSAMELARIYQQTDVRHVLPSITAPTLILDRAGCEPEQGKYTESLIRGAQHVTLPGDDEPPYAGDQDSVVSAIADFLRIQRPVPELNRVLTTVLYTDIVGSTQRAAELGDRAWRELVDAHHQRVRDLLTQFRGREIDTAGDGFLAIFDGPARAVRCAQAIAVAILPLGIKIRAGLHTGEVELADDAVRGIAVHIGARVAGLAGAGDVLVSSTVKDLVAGSGLVFEDAGERELKGVPDRWRLYRVVSL